jgi:hypothetical protein
MNKYTFGVLKAITVILFILLATVNAPAQIPVMRILYL